MGPTQQRDWRAQNIFIISAKDCKKSNGSIVVYTLSVTDKNRFNLT